MVSSLKITSLIAGLGEEEDVIIDLNWRGRRKLQLLHSSGGDGLATPTRGLRRSSSNNWYNLWRLCSAIWTRKPPSLKVDATCGTIQHCLQGTPFWVKVAGAWNWRITDIRYWSLLNSACLVALSSGGSVLWCVVSHFSCSVHEIFALLGCYIA
jgi:hypothetical protein